MPGYKFLALTDHRGHSMENSLYAILSKLADHPECECIHVASRGNDKNHPFFYENKGTEIFVHEVTSSFAFDQNDARFMDNAKCSDFDDYDVVLMRLPRPVETSLLEALAEKGKDKVIINDPLAIEKTSTKAYLLNFREWCPFMRLCYNIEDILDMAEQGPIVLKPLKEYGGRGILKIDGNKLTDGNNNFDTKSYLEGIESYIQKEGFLVMEFLKNVSMGDKRIIVVGGEIMAASLRLPARGSWLCNVAQGGQAVGSEVEDEEKKMIAAISPKLLEEGIFIYGADTLVNNEGKRVLSEINTLSIGGFPQAEIQTGRPVVGQLINKIIEYVNDKKRQ
jgi:glutathione synthase